MRGKDTFVYGPIVCMVQMDAWSATDAECLTEKETHGENSHNLYVEV